ncbi:hypothetical protein PR048_023257 [Dryococelus australis]|uniref:Major facilitator superfamily (MFS) profile domain-containing protein n=1 Tax=Dryococelus australis TaxID=614101 RepID=A0ABQ9GTL0_9NEOP|nr:hypothetical protein PR048_023257 [Dryococelus australis]
MVPVNMTSFVYGVAIGWPSPTIPLLQSADNPVGGGAPMTVSSASWLGSLLNVGALAATPVYAYFCDEGSRKMVGYVVGLCGAVGWLLVVVAPAEAVLLAARVVIGKFCGGDLLHSTIAQSN